MEYEQPFSLVLHKKLGSTCKFYFATYSSDLDYSEFTCYYQQQHVLGGMRQTRKPLWEPMECLDPLFLSAAQPTDYLITIFRLNKIIIQTIFKGRNIFNFTINSTNTMNNWLIQFNYSFFRVNRPFMSKFF